MKTKSTKRNALPISREIIKQMTDIVANEYTIPQWAIYARKQPRQVTQARQMLFFLLKTIKKLSYDEIAMIFGRTRPTVWRAENDVRQRLDNDFQTRIKFNVILKQLEENGLY